VNQINIFLVKHVAHPWFNNYILAIPGRKFI